MFSLGPSVGRAATGRPRARVKILASGRALATTWRAWTTIEERTIGQEDLIECAMRPIHPGEILRDELAELGLSARAFARAALDIPVNRVSQILHEQRGADTALRLARHFGTSPSSGWICRAISSSAARAGRSVRPSSGRPTPAPHRMDMTASHAHRAKPRGSHMNDSGT
jgi:antitoxin HigA-1